VKRDIRILRRAQNDLIEIERYLHRDAPEAAEQIVDELLRAIERLARLRHMGPNTRDERLKRLAFRYLACGRYLVFYKVLRAQVRIYRVLHHRRGYDRLL
jgi:toxin ParE1/3/4